MDGCKRMQSDCQNGSNSPIRNFYAGKKILLTGSTGFVGKSITEKLLRTCTGIEAIYTLIRPKKDRSIEDRMKKYFKDTIFSRISKENPNVFQKVIPISGDLLKSDLGLSFKDRQLIVENVDIIIHNAATVYFDEHISVALKVNVLATQKMLDLAAECSHLKAFMYISTAYSHCYKQVIEEKFYPPPADLNMIDDMIKADSENKNGLSDDAIQTFLGQWTNKYTFTKSAAEGLVEKFGKTASFPCGVFRPSIVVGTYNEPIPAWCGNRNGPVMVCLGIYLGFLHVVHLPKNPALDIIPVDMTSNALLAMIWDLAVHGKPQEPNMYNFGSSNINPYHLRHMKHQLSTLSKTYPSLNSVWPYFVLLTRSYFAFFVFNILLHFVPSVFVDLLLIVQGRKPLAMAIFFKLFKNMDTLIKFTNGDWKIEVKAMQSIWHRMTPADREDFNFDLRILNWRDYTFSYWKGLKEHILNESPDTLPAARRRYRKLELLQNTIVTILMLLALYFVYKVVRCSCNFF